MAVNYVQGLGFGFVLDGSFSRVPNKRVEIMQRLKRRLLTAAAGFAMVVWGSAAHACVFNICCAGGPGFIICCDMEYGFCNIIWL
jgi:hypothetical protein